MPVGLEAFSASQLAGPTRHITPPTSMGPGRFTTPPQPVGPTSHINIPAMQAWLERLGIRQGDTAPQEIGPTALTSRSPKGPEPAPRSSGGVLGGVGEGVPLRAPYERERMRQQALGDVASAETLVQAARKLLAILAQRGTPWGSAEFKGVRDAYQEAGDWRDVIGEAFNSGLDLSSLGTPEDQSYA